LNGIKVRPISPVQQELLAAVAQAMHLTVAIGLHLLAGCPLSVVKPKEESKAGSEQGGEATGSDGEAADEVGVVELEMEDVNTQENCLYEHLQHTCNQGDERCLSHVLSLAGYSLSLQSPAGIQFGR
jgi:hypothetical protein